MAFLADNGDTIIPAQAYQEIPTSVAFQTDDLDAFDFDCDDAPLTKAVLMANLSSYDSDVILDVPFHDINIKNDMGYQSVQETQCSEQPFVDNDTEIDITSDSNIISYEQYLQENENSVVQNISSSAQQDELLTIVIEEMSSQVAKCNKVQQENLIVHETLTAELERYKEQVADFEKQIHSLKLQLNATVESHKTLSTTVECLKKESKQKEDKYLNEVIDLQNKTKALDNVIYQIDKKYLEIEKKELSLDIDRLVVHIICQDVMNHVMHANDHSDNVLPANNNSLEHDNSALELLKHENDHLMELLIYQDLVHTAVNSIAAINDFKSMEQRLGKLGVSYFTEASESNHRSNTKKDRITQTSSSNKKTNKVEDQPRIAKSSFNNVNRVSKIVCTKNVKHFALNVNSELVCATCHECMFDVIHDLCVRDYLVDVNARVKSKSVKYRSAKSKKKKLWKPTGKVYTNVIQTVLWYLDSGYSKRMTGQCSQLINFVSKFFSTIRFGNDQIAKIIGYGDYQLRNVTISWVYYVEGLNLDGADLLSGLRDINLYTISLNDMLNSSPICLLSKTSKIKSWLWHKGDILFQPMFDEFFNPSPSVVSTVPTAIAQRAADPTGSPVSTSLEQDAPSTSNYPNPKPPPKRTRTLY
ncbi:hypothetical protein Tco_0816324 [Tanacetum coccineum]